MKSFTHACRPAARWFWRFFVVIVFTAGGVLGYTYWQQKNAAAAQTDTPSYATRQVRLGSINLTASGSITLVPSQEKSLAFTVEGVVAELNAAVGDSVKKAQVLAQLDSLEELEAEIKNANQDLLSAQQNLAALKAKAPANLANAKLKVIQAQAALEDAQDSVVQKDWSPCDAETETAFLDAYNRAVKKLNALGDGGGNADYYLNTILPQKKVVNQALGAYQACTGYSDYQVASSQINVVAAQSALKQAEGDLEILTQNGGLDPTELAVAENQIATAQQALEDARDDLEGAILTAPFDGTVLSVAGKAGDAVEVTTRNPSVTFITISDLAHPLLEFRVDETDMQMVAKGESAEVIFDAFPERTFTGTVIRVNPAISDISGVPYVTGLIELDLTRETDVPAFPKNLSGSVNIIQSSANDVLLIPIEALRLQKDGTYGVYILGADDQPVFKTVEIGLQDVASVEIKSGLTADDIVITSEMP